MENLKNYLLEKLDSEIKDKRNIVKDFIRRNYTGVSNIKFEKELTEDGKLIVNGIDISVKNKDIEELTTDDFIFGKVNWFFCEGCKRLKSLKGAPTKCNSFYVINCPKIDSLEYIPTELEYHSHNKMANKISFRWYKNGKDFSEEDFRKICKDDVILTTNWVWADK